VEAKELLREGRSGFSGRLRVSCSIAVARRLLIPALPRWQALHPELSLELDVSDRFASLVEDQVDVALRAGVLANSSLIARPIAHTQRIAVAAFEYLRSRSAPFEPEDLQRHDCIVFPGVARPNQWEFEKGRRSVSVKVPSRLSVSTVDALYDAVRAGLGIALIPSWFCKNALADGSFVRVLSNYRLPTLTMHAVTLAKPPAGGKIHAFVQFAERLFKDSLI
jgi:LysR family transcriptional regulator, regulator for bpeEF and oprC